MTDATTSAPTSATISGTGTAWRTTRLRLWGGLTMLAVVLRAPTFVTRYFDPDEAAISVEAMVVRSGGKLYRDIYDRKPPLPALLYAASFSITDSLDIRPMRFLVTILLALCGVLVAFECLRRWGPRHAWWGGVLMVAGAMALFPADAGAANWAHFALLPGTAAIIWSRRGTLPSAVAAGVAIGVAILARQSWLLGVLPACVSVGRSGRWRNVAPFLVVAGLVVATTGFYAPLGTFWQWNVTNVPGFVFAGTGLIPATARGLASVAGFSAFHPTLLAAAGISVAAGVTVIRRRALPDDIDLWLWFASGVLAWGAGFRFFGHYWLQVVPPLVLLAAPVVARWSGRIRQLAIAGVAVPTAVAWALLFVPGSFHNRPNPARLADYVRSHTSQSDRVFIWGSYPELQVAADRLPGGAMVHTDFVVGRSGGRENPSNTLASAVPGAADIMLAQLRDDPPQLIVDTSSSPRLGYTRYPTSLVPDLDKFIHDGYEQVAIIDDVGVWQRRP